MIFLFTSLGIFNGCKQLGIRENREEPEWNCNVEETEESRKRDKERFELDKKRRFDFNGYPIDETNRSGKTIIDTINYFQKSSFDFFSYKRKAYSQVYFIAHEVDFDTTIKRFKESIKDINLIDLYILVCSENQQFVEIIISSCLKQNVNISHLCIHSKVPSSISIIENIKVNSVDISGILSKIVFDSRILIQEFYIYPTDSLTTLKCNLEKASKFILNGKAKTDNILASLKFGNRLKYFKIVKSEIQNIPDLSSIRELEYFSLSYMYLDTLNFKKFPSKLVNLVMRDIKYRMIVPTDSKKRITKYSVFNDKNILGQYSLSDELLKLKE